MVMSGLCPDFMGLLPPKVLTRCVWCGFEPRSGHVRQTKFSLRVCQIVLFFSGFSPFSSHLLIDASHMSGNNHERDVKLNKKNEPKVRMP